ncbi:MAG: LLM class F420-dependent oxidoreductase [Acidimicrobiales bacterium]|jgi:F420-dependent oxidoreductase-like protein
MDLRVFTEPQQGASFSRLLAVAQRSEQLGFSGFFRSDHYLYIGEGAPRPDVTDAWTTLAALAVRTSKIRLGTLMSSATFRLPGPLAVSIAQVDAMSGGRLEVGIGAGWYEREHRALAIPFPSVQDRFDRLEEQLEILHGLWASAQGERFDYEGRHYRIEDCPVVFQPVQQPHPPVILGGYGHKRTPALAARFATEFNMPGPGIGQVVEQFARVDRACLEIGRDPASLTRSVWLTVCIGRDEAEFRKRAAAIGRDPAALRQGAIAGIPAEATDSLERYREVGVSRVYLQFLDLEDADHLELAAEVFEVGG